MAGGVIALRAMPSQWLIRGWGGTKTSIWFVEGPFARSGSPSALTTTLVARDAERRRAGIFEADAFLEEPAFVLAFAEANAAEEMHRIATPLAAMVVLPTEKPDALSKVERCQVGLGADVGLRAGRGEIKKVGSDWPQSK